MKEKIVATLYEIGFYIDLVLEVTLFLILSIIAGLWTYLEISLKAKLGFNCWKLSVVGGFLFRSWLKLLNIYDDCSYAESLIDLLEGTAKQRTKREFKLDEDFKDAIYYFVDINMA